MTMTIRGYAAVGVAAVLGSALLAATVQAVPSSWPAPVAVTPSNALPGLVGSFGWRAGSLALADFDNDGQIDAAVPGAYVGGACIVQADGTQTWLTTGNWPVAVAAADLDGDGDVDLAVAEQDGGGVSILTNDGAGTMTRTAFHATGTGAVGATAVLAVDMDKDGRLDLVVANRYAETVVVLHNTGGGFLVWQTLPVPAEPNALAAADLNNDGWLDIAVACAADDTVKVLKSFGGLLVRSGTFPAGPYPVAVAAADLNGDGRVDLAVADREAPQVTVLLNDGAGGFAVQDEMLLAPGYGAFEPPADVQLVDMDANGTIDIRCAGTTLYNNGAAGFIHAGLIILTSPEPWTAVVYARGFLAGEPYPFLAEAYRAAEMPGYSHNYGPDTVAVTWQAPPLLNSVPGDVDGDDLVDVLDLLWLVDSFGTCVGDTGFLPACDFNRDGCVDVGDLLTIVYNFGT